MMSLPKTLFHVTRAQSVASILKTGLLTSYYGAVHGGMDIHPPYPAIYLSRKPQSDNLHSSLFLGATAVLSIDTCFLDPAHFWPDDAVYSQFCDSTVLADTRSVATAFHLSHQAAQALLDRFEQATDCDLPGLLKPAWAWYLAAPFGGEVAYTRDIPATAITIVS